MPSTTSSSELPPNTIRVKLIKQKHAGLGFLVKQRTLKPFVLVASIVKGGVAEESGLVQIGDIILRINDVDLTDMSYPSAIEVLKAVPIDTPVVLLLRGPEGYTTYLQTTFMENGVPRTVRVTKVLHDSIMGRIKKTFSGSSGQISPVKGLKRLCNGELDGRNKKGEDDITDKDADSTGGGDDNTNVVSVEELADPPSRQPIRPESGGQDKKPALNGEAVTGVASPLSGEASKFLFRNEGRVDSEEETVLDNGTVGSPKIVLTSPKSKDGSKPGPMPRAQTFDSGVGDSCRSPCQKKSIEIIQTDDVITVVVKGDLTVHSEDTSSTDPNTPKKFIISSTKHSQPPLSSSTNLRHEPIDFPAHAETAFNPPNSSLSRNSSRKKSGRASPNTCGRVSPGGGRGGRSPATSPTKHPKSSDTNDEDNGRVGRGSEKRRATSPALGRRKSTDRRGSVASTGMTSPKRFVRVKNMLDDKTYRTLYTRRSSRQFLVTQTGAWVPSCPCSSSAPGNTRTTEDLLIHAKDFIDQYYTSIKRNNTQSHHNRWTEIQESVDQHGTYDLTSAELNFGAKQAWRNAPRCIGRIQWSKLQVFDARHILTARSMFEALCNHIKYGTNKGSLRSAITIFPHRKANRRDFGVWNAQLIRYAGYRAEDGAVTGDPANVEFTEQCVKLGWKPRYGQFDILPLVLSAAGSDPEWFDIPHDLVLEVNIKHPKYPWFADLGLKWYALPAVSGMLFDCGGLEFPACPFNGWYMGTEIGARNFCDTSRYNMLETIATNMGLDIMKNASLWKDRAMVECNVAVLHSYQANGVTITDHHSASESFIKHMENEQKLRGGCPGDWVWVVPPLGGSLLEVFHQELLLYKLKPSYEYQDEAWKTHVWKKDREKLATVAKTKRKIGFKELARAVKFSAKLMGKASARRVKCVILYATETGKSEKFANTLTAIFKHAFDAKVMCMPDYDIISLEHESLVLVVASTFGNGDPPENGDAFAINLFDMKSADLPPNGDHSGSRTHSSYVRLSISSDKGEKNDANNGDSLVSIKGPLGNVRFSVFALGSKAYPHFAAFGHYIHDVLHDLGAECIFPIGTGDELCAQEQSFRLWAEGVFTAACETFCLGDDVNIYEATGALNSDHSWTPNKFRLTLVDNAKDLNICDALTSFHGKTVVPCILSERIQLQEESSDRQTILIKLNTQGSSELLYVPGDHVGVFLANPKELVDGVLARLHNSPPPDQIVKAEYLSEVSTPLGTKKTWTQIEKMPTCSMRLAFTQFLDLTTPPSQSLLSLLATQATRDSDREKLELLATDATAYEKWRYELSPNMLEVLDQFSSLKVLPTLLMTQLPHLLQRYYSISSSPLMFPGEVHATIDVVKFRTQDGAGPIHEGVCSGWLNRCDVGTVVPCLVRTAQSFHMPEDKSLPIIMVGPGTGIAPFRSFWQERCIDLEMYRDQKNWGEMVLYFGCRTSTQDNIYKQELDEYSANHVLTKFYVALSREPNTPKVYVQDILYSRAPEVYDAIVKKGGHFYVCGDVAMAHDVTRTLETLLKEQGDIPLDSATIIVDGLRDANRFHEDIFGVNVRKPGDLAELSKDRSVRALQYLNAISKPDKPDALKEIAVCIKSTEETGDE
uniref:Nitric oxide synthase 1 n=1 Tax=Ambigolimax valentianus TaxID=1338344 RepID=C4TP54_9EUPU